MNDTLSTTYEKLRNEHTERSLIGCCLIDPDVFRHAQGLTAEIFTRPDCRTVFGVMRDLWEANREFDAVSVAEGLARKGRLEDIGGTEGLESLMGLVPGSYNAERHAQILEELRQRRAIWDAHMRRAGAAADLEISLPDVLEFSAMPAVVTSSSKRFEILTAGELYDTVDWSLPEPVVDGLCRRGEVMNFISGSKVGKSWAVYQLALSLAVGRPWLGFETKRGRSLIIDNELMQSNLLGRLARVGHAMQLEKEEWQGQVSILSLRGALLDIDGISRIVEPVQGLSLVVIDCLYRALPEGISENDNAQMARVYNRLDKLAGETGAAVVITHHLSKGVQFGKSTTDRGAGAGAVSRAADSHIVLTPHETPGIAVLESALRSFPPHDPIAIAWQWPLWEPAADDIDVSKVQGRRKSGAEKMREESSKLAETEREAILAALEALPQGNLLHQAGIVARAEGAGVRIHDKRIGAHLEYLTSTGAVVVVDDYKPNKNSRKTAGYCLAGRLPAPAAPTALAGSVGSAGGLSEHSADISHIPHPPYKGVRVQDVAPEETKNKRKGKARRRKGAVVVDTSESLVEPSAAVDVTFDLDAVPEVVSADVSEGVPF
jgi:hypothetical protein